MKDYEAIKIINEAAWRPGMRVHARPYRTYGSGGDYIEVSIGWDTYDSSVISDEGEYTERAMIAPSGVMPVDDFQTSEELLYQVLRWVRDAQEHEDREFCRVKRDGKWVAPFHPHREDGNALYRNKGKAVPQRNYYDALRELGVR